MGVNDMRPTGQDTTHLMLRAALLLAITVGAILANPTSAYACRCGVGTPADGMADADAVFSGRAIAEGPNHSSPPGTQTLQIIDRWKGVPNDVIALYVGFGSCSYFFEADQSYLVYASRSSSGEYWTDLCTRTNLLASAEEDLTYMYANHEVIDPIQTMLPLIAY